MCPGPASAQQYHIYTQKSRPHTTLATHLSHMIILRKVLVDEVFFMRDEKAALQKKREGVRD